MTFNISQAAMHLAAQIIGSLKTDSARVKALAVSEGKHLAYGLARIAELLGSGQINGEEAEMLVRVQRDASEATLAALAEISRIAARKAIGRGLEAITGLVDQVIGMPLIGNALRP
jgi:hypothetical protein